MKLCQGNRQVAQSAAEAAIAFNYNIGPLALKPQEWLSTLLAIHGQQRKAEAIASIRVEDLQPYTLEHYDRQTVTLCNVDDEQIMVRRTSYFNIQTSILKDRDTNGCIGNYAKYDGEWYPSSDKVKTQLKDSYFVYVFSDD